VEAGLTVLLTHARLRRAAVEGKGGEDMAARRFCVILLAFVLLALPNRVLTQASSTTDPKKVKSPEELRAKTPSQQGRAIFFDQPGASVWQLSPGDRMIIIGEPPDPSAPDVPWPGAGPSSPRPPVDPRRARICNSDAVVVGLVISSEVLLNKSETFLFTDINIQVKHWVRPASGYGTILVSVIGGAVELAGRVIRTEAVAVPPLNQPRVWYLHRFPRRDGIAQQNGFVLNGPPEQIGNPTQVADLITRLDGLGRPCAGGPR
jgi:hypothetical protein